MDWFTAESTEFKQWWNENCDPDETGRTRMMASYAFEAGMAKAREIRDKDDAEVNMLEAEAEV